MSNNKNKQQQNKAANTAPTTNNSTSPREHLSFASLVVNSIRETILGRLKSKEDQVSTLYDTFGYKKDISYNDYYRAYRRQGIAKRIINANVDFTWKNMPSFVDEDEDANKVIKSETAKNKGKAVKHTGLKLNASHRRHRTVEQNDEDETPFVEPTGERYTLFEESIYELDKRFKLLTMFKKADKLNCIGRFSVIVIGTKVPITDNAQVNSMEQPMPKGTSLNDIAFFKVYSEGQTTINTWETDKANPRYGMPKLYSIQVQEEGGQSSTYKVHWTRVIHIAEDLLDSEVYGTPKLEAVYNDLQDLLKIVGGSAEMFWLGAYQGLVFNVKDGYSLDEAAARDITDQIENYVNKVQRFIKTKGIEVSTLQSGTADPGGNFNVLIDLISGASNVPKRILLGAENGVYAGNTDQDTFYSYIASRRNGFIEEVMIRPFIDRLVEYGYIKPAVNNEYSIEWPPLFEQTQTEKLTNAGLMITAAKNATPFGNTLDIINVEEVREAIGLPAEKPETMYDEYADEGDVLSGEDEIDLLPEEDDTVGDDVHTIINKYREQKQKKFNERGGKGESKAGNKR